LMHHDPKRHQPLTPQPADALERESSQPPGLAAILGLQQAVGNQAVSRLLQRGMAPTHAPVIQRVIPVSLEPKHYGRPPSTEAYTLRMSTPGITPFQNIATFHLIPRPNGTANPDDPTPGPYTQPSTGHGVYQEAGGRAQYSYRINPSHSEHQIIEQDIKALVSGTQYPQKYIIDYVYTERPACPDVWHFNNKIHDGCKTELEKLERLQKERRWDADGGAPSPYALRDDLNITVFSTFDSEAQQEIQNALLTNPVRNEYVSQMKALLERYYQSKYAETGVNEEYDTRDYDAIPQRALEEADEAIPEWSDYDLSLNIAGIQQFRGELQEVLDTKKSELGIR
jgi:hypothetical protein